MSIYYPGDESLSKTIVSEKVILVKRRLFMNWASFFCGFAVAAVVVGVAALLWHFDKLKDVQSWGHLLLGVVCALVAVALGLQLFTIGGFWAWCWKLPVAIVAGMMAIVSCDVGLHGDRTR